VVGRRGLDQGGPGVGRAVAEWMIDGNPEIDVHHSDIARFYPHQRTRAHIRARTSEAFNKTYGIVHPRGAVEQRPQPAARPDAREPARARRSVLSRRRAGNARSGTRPTSLCSATTAATG
jgi:hypothetical protein